MEEKPKLTKKQIIQAAKNLAKMAKEKAKNEKTKRHTDMNNMFKPVSKKLHVRLVSPPPVKRLSPIVKEIDEMGSLDSIEKIDKAIDFFMFPTIKYDKEADLHIQIKLRNDAKMLDYYHKKMNGYFGFEHPLPKKKGEQRLPEPKEKRRESKQPRMKVVVMPEKERNKEEAKVESTAPVFEAIETKTWILDWECATFKEGYFTVYSPNGGSIHFEPLNVRAKESTGALNYLKMYLKKKLPPIFCTIVGKHGKLKINDSVRLNEAIQIFAKAAKQHAAKVKRNTVTPQPAQMTFNQAMSKAQQMSASDFRKYKSKFIDFLVDLQDEHYKVIPCVERLAHTRSDASEFAFMFSLKCRSGRILVIHENVNPDRSTLMFTIREENYMKSVRSLYDFLQSEEINKRSALRDRDFELDELGVGWYNSINHDELENWKWNIKYYINHK